MQGEYRMSMNDLFKLKDNPFRMTPPIDSNEIVWAGFPELKKKLEDKIRRAMQFSNSSLILNWGEYGSGKTHAANYFNQENILESLAEKSNKKKPFSLKITLPTGKNPVYDIFISVLEHLDIQRIRSDFKEISRENENFIDQYFRNNTIRNILRAIFSEKVDINLLKKYLFNEISSRELKKLNDCGILRKLTADDERTMVLAGIFTCLTYKRKVFSEVIVWIDEFENITFLNNFNVDNTNKFIRELIDNTPNFILIFLNFTMAPFRSVEDLGQYLSTPVISRLRDRVEFAIPDEASLKLYLEELLNHEFYRTEKQENIYHPFTIEAIDLVIEMLENVSLRRYNEAFSTLLELAEFDNVQDITPEFVRQYKNDIIGWKDLK
jgi:hypothetical protein